MAADLKGLAGVNGSHNDTPYSTPGGSTTPADDRPLLKSHSSASNASAAAAESMEELDGKYAPFVRRDAYGTMGRGELSVAEKVVLGIAAVMLVPIRLVMGVTILVVYYLICRICTLFSAPNREDEQEDYAHLSGWRRKVIVRCGRFFPRALLFTFGFYWIKETRITNDDNTIKQAKDSKRPGAVVSNHISYVDILYHMSSSFPSFVAKRSVSKLPLIGLISKCLGCVYVQRESKSFNFKGVSGVVTERIQEAHEKEFFPMMLLFPEGTTTNGDYLLPFKSGAFLAKVPVLPVILRYPYSRFSPAWDSISGVRHVFLLLCQFVNYIEVIQLPIYYPSEQEEDDVKLYANNVRKLMATEGNLTLSEIGLAEKRIYHAVLNGSVPTVVLLVPFMYVEYSETFTFSIKKNRFVFLGLFGSSIIYNTVNEWK